MKAKGKVIIPNIPADARRNLAKLDRHMERRASMVKINPQAKRLDRRSADAKTIKIIYRDEGADACLSCCKHYKMSRREMLLLLAAFEAKK